MQAYRFAFEDSNAWKTYLDENGFVVIKQVADTNHIAKATDLMWQFLEALETGIDRHNPNTWINNNWPMAFATGIISQHGIGQSDFMWYCRLIPGIRRIFETIWDQKELLVSYDGAGIFRSPEYNKTKANGSWYHIDQNPTHQPGRCAIQGALNLLPSSQKDGGFLVLPGSHRIFSAFTALKIGESRPKKRYFTIQDHMDVYDGIRPIKVNAEPGDFILWDSRTAHCNCQPSDKSKTRQIVRMVAYICMTPKSMADTKTIDSRRGAIVECVTTNHWPHYYCPNSGPRFPHKNIPTSKKVPPCLSLTSLPEAKSLIASNE
jgi:ectoine hydroxylase-related dioxygenase (phytanoyl-CoA dioxygenase family)